jgi:hypothetical protein
MPLSKRSSITATNERSLRAGFGTTEKLVGNIVVPKSPPSIPASAAINAVNGPRAQRNSRVEGPASLGQSTVTRSTPETSMGMSVSTENTICVAGDKQLVSNTITSSDSAVSADRIVRVPL